VLEAFATYADRMGLSAEPGFSPKQVKWLIRLSSEGKLIGIDPLGETEAKKNPGLTIENCPEYPGSAMVSGGKAHPLVETLNVVCLMPAKEGDEVPEKDIAKWEHFVGLLEELSDELGEAKVASDALRSSDTRDQIISELTKQKAKVTDKATIAVGDAWLVQQEPALNWWRTKRSGPGTESSGTSLDLISGELVQPLASHPKIMGLGSVGGSSIGSSLISFDKDAFTSYGLEQSENAAVSDANAARYRAGLNHLIQNGQRFGPMIVGYWYSGDVAQEDDIMAWFTEPSKADEADALSRARLLIEAIRAGSKPKLTTARYSIVHISGSSGRVMIRSWHEGSFARLAENVNNWFADLAIVSSDGQTIVRTPKLMAVAATTVREIDNLTTETTLGLHAAGCFGAKIPLPAVIGALARTRIDLIEDTIRPDRMALLKTFLIRNTKYGEHMTPYLNEDHPSVAYHAGRMLSVYANVQQAALGDVNANVVQRFFPSAMATPNLVFGRLAKLCEFHLNKLDGGLKIFFQEKIGKIAGPFGDGLPKTFNSEEQALFALGYYQQLAFDAYDRRQRGAATRAAKNDTQNNGDTE